MGKSKKKKNSKANHRRQDKAPKRATLRQQTNLSSDKIASILARAEQCDQPGSERKIVESLRPLGDNPTISDQLQRCRFYRLQAIGHAHNGAYDKAEVAIAAGLKECPDNPDLYYMKAYVAFSMREHEASIEAGLKVISLATGNLRRVPQLKEYSYTENRLSQLLNVIASAYREQKERDAASEFFERAILADPGNPLPYINLAMMLKTFGNLTTSSEVVTVGLNHCSQVHELRMLEEAFKKKASISACMMVKDEEELLPGCLESIRNWVDEIVLVDTGSTDRTVEIAESYGARIYHQPWANDFSLHRNYSTSLATGDWILIIDADERIVEEDVPMLLQAIVDDRFGVVSFNVINVYGTDEAKVTFLNSFRLFRRELDLKYEGIVHNVLKIPTDIPVLRTSVRLKHLGYDLSNDKMKKKFERSKPLLEKQLAENPDNTFALFNYAQLLLGEGMGRWEEFSPQIVKAAGRAVELTDPNDHNQRPTHLMCLNQVAYASLYVQDRTRSIEYARRALDIKPDYLDPMLVLAHTYGELGETDQSNLWFEKYLETQQAFDGTTNRDSLILFHPASRASAHYGLGRNAERAGDPVRARENFLKVCALDNGYYDTNSQLGKIYMGEEKYDEAEKYFLAQREHSFTDMVTALGLAYINLRRENETEFLKYHRIALELEMDKVHPSSLVRLGQLYLNFDRNHEAIDVFKKALSVGHDDLQLRSLLAGACYRGKLYADAAEHYRVILKDNPNSPEILNDLANCCFNMEQYEQAEKYYAQVLQAKEVPVITYLNYGLTAARLEKPKEAIAALGQYIELEPNQPAIRRILGDLYSRTGNFEAAIACFEHCLKDDSSDPVTLFGLSDCYLHMGHRDSAILGYRRILDLDPDFEPARRRLEQCEQATASSGKATPVTG